MPATVIDKQASAQSILLLFGYNHHLGKEIKQPNTYVAQSSYISLEYRKYEGRLVIV